MPDDLTYPYRPRLANLLIAVGAFALIVYKGRGPVGSVFGLASTHPDLLTYSIAAFFGVFAVALIVGFLWSCVPGFFAWTRNAAITLNRSELIVPVGLTRRETAIPLAEVTNVRSRNYRGQYILTISRRAGKNIRIASAMLPTAEAFAKFQAELDSRIRAVHG